MNLLLLEKQFAREQKHITSSIERFKEALSDKSIKVISSDTLEDAKFIIKSNIPIDCLVLTKTLYEKRDTSTDSEEVQMIDLLHERQPNVPVFLLSDNGNITHELDLELFKKIKEFIWILEDTLEFVVGRITSSINNYRKNLLPPLIKELKKYYKTFEYSWVIPGHQGGVGLRKTPAGRAFFDFFGENVFITDWNSARAPIGSLLGHSGAFKESEENISRIFGSDVSFSAVVGSSGSNRTIMQYCIKEGQSVLVDRNCHKSITHGLILTGAKPIYMKPTRNAYGIIGPIGAEEMKNAAKDNKGEVSYAVVTNSTFDGICYNSEEIEKNLQSLPYVHLDEAWFAHARFNPLYNRMYSMRGDPKDRAANAEKESLSTLFSTHSSHKLLNALGQCSYIHIRNGNKSGNEVQPEKFNQFYMMHTTTSPSYILLASNDIAAHMMNGESGHSITQEMISEAVNFRQSLARLFNDFRTKGEWFFKPWNAEQIDGVSFENVDTEKLITNQKYWMLRSKDEWHGFGEDLDDDWVMLDPVKVSVITPGINNDYSFQDVGISASLVNMWLNVKGVVPCRYTDFQLIFLFTPGITKGKWGTLIDHFLQFKNHYQLNTKLKYALPDLYAKHIDVYQSIGGLRDLNDRMFDFLKQEENNLGFLLNKAFEDLPEIKLSPKAAFSEVTDDSSEYVRLDDLSYRISATTLIPYPPGIPLIVPGEQFGDQNSSHIRYLKALERWDKTFPGFEHETTGVFIGDDGHYRVCVLAK